MSADPPIYLRKPPKMWALFLMCAIGIPLLASSVYYNGSSNGDTGGSTSASLVYFEAGSNPFDLHMTFLDGNHTVTITDFRAAVDFELTMDNVLSITNDDVVSYDATLTLDFTGYDESQFATLEVWINGVLIVDLTNPEDVVTIPASTSYDVVIISSLATSVVEVDPFGFLLRISAVA